MFKLLPIIGICVLLAVMSEKNSNYDYGSERYVSKDRFFFCLLTIVAVFFAGLRTDYNDTHGYILSYQNFEYKGLTEGIEWNLGDYPGFFMVRNWLKGMGFSAQFYIFIFTLFTVAVELWFIRKYTNNIALSVFLFFAMGCYGFLMGAVKQCASIAFCLIAVDRQIQKKYIRFALYVIIASLFHPFSILFFITPFLEFRPWTFRTFILIGGSAALGFSMQSWLGRLIDFINLMGKDYDESLLVGEGVNIFRLAVLWAPVALSFLTRMVWDKEKDDPIQNLMINLMMLNASIMFIAFFGNPIYFGRLANYFLIFQTIGLTYLLQYFEDRSRTIMIWGISIAYFLYCYYGYALGGNSFDSGFNAVSLLEFVTHIFE